MVSIKQIIAVLGACSVPLAVHGTQAIDILTWMNLVEHSNPLGSSPIATDWPKQSTTRLQHIFDGWRQMAGPDASRYLESALQGHWVVENAAIAYTRSQEARLALRGFIEGLEEQSRYDLWPQFIESCRHTIIYPEDDNFSLSAALGPFGCCAAPQGSDSGKTEFVFQYMKRPDSFPAAGFHDGNNFLFKQSSSLVDLWIFFQEWNRGTRNLVTAQIAPVPWFFRWFGPGSKYEITFPAEGTYKEELTIQGTFTHLENHVKLYLDELEQTHFNRRCSTFNIQKRACQMFLNSRRENTRKVFQSRKALTDLRQLYLQILVSHDKNNDFRQVAQIRQNELDRKEDFKKSKKQTEPRTRRPRREKPDPSRRERRRRERPDPSRVE